MRDLTTWRLMFRRPLTPRDIERLIGNPLREYPVGWAEAVKVRPETVERVRQVQRERGVTVDGVLGPQTWCAIPNTHPWASLTASARRLRFEGDRPW